MATHGDRTDTTGRHFLDSVGNVVGLSAAIVGIMGGLFALYDRATRPSLDLELLLPISGWEVLLRNVGATSARQIRLGVVVWRNADGAPGPDVRRSYAVHDLGPGGDAATVRIEVVADAEDPAYRTYRATLSTSGYVVVSCDRCPVPRAWAFHIPGSGEHDKQTRFFPWSNVRWPVVEFTYPARAPRLYDCVDYPRGVCNGRLGTWYAESGSSRPVGPVITPPATDAR